MVYFIKNVLGKTIRIAYKITYRFIPCHQKIILFISFHGKGFSDNPKALYEYMQTQPQYQGYHCVWAIKHHKQKKIHIENAKVIEYFSISYFYYLARSKYWFVNCKLPSYVLKKPQQVYLQTWHGTPLKRLAHDIEVPIGTTFYRSKMSYEQMKKTYDDDVKKYNYMISPNTYSSTIFQSAFQINKERLLESGYPRTDVLVHVKEDEVNQLKKSLGIPLDKKVILYAPTWRDNSFVAKGYTFTLQVDFALWKDRLQEEYVIIFKPHYLIVNQFDISQYKGFVYEAKAEYDISQLYIMSDILITDYSSAFFDYAIMSRPIYFYMFDLGEYAQELRGFYFNIYTTLPGDIVDNETDLLTCICDGKFDYVRLKSFNEQFNAWNDGTCSKKVIETLLP